MELFAKIALHLGQISQVKEDIKNGLTSDSPFRKWKDATEKFTTHTISDYHTFSTIAADNFLIVYSGKTDDISIVTDT